MESTDSAFRFPAGLPISRGWLRSALLIGTWMWVWPVMAQLQGTGGLAGMRVAQRRRGCRVDQRGRSTLVARLACGEAVARWRYFARDDRMG